MNDVKVSISCLAYNHETYIAQTIESFLMQKTNFPFEILIHDDASTDRTAQIIKQYEEKYPHLIKPIYQTENQYSQGVRVGFLNRQRAKGKYIALCEGDDYWTDPLKLQKQFDFMEANPEYSLCVHAGMDLRSEKVFQKHSDIKVLQNRALSMAEIIEFGGIILTNSMFFKSEKAQEIPTFCNDTKAGDYTLVLQLAITGAVYYMKDTMSVYRIATSNSWTVKEYSTVDSIREHNNHRLTLLDDFNIITNFKYVDLINKRKLLYKFEVELANSNPAIFENEDYKKIYKEYDLKRKISLFLKLKAPSFHQFLKNIKNKLAL